MTLTFTTTKQARMKVQGALPTMGEMRALVAEADAFHIPDSGTVETHGVQSSGLLAVALTVTWTAAS